MHGGKLKKKVKSVVRARLCRVEKKRKQTPSWKKLARGGCGANTLGCKIMYNYAKSCAIINRAKVSHEYIMQLMIIVYVLTLCISGYESGGRAQATTPNGRTIAGAITEYTAAVARAAATTSAIAWTSVPLPWSWCRSLALRTVLKTLCHFTANTITVSPKLLSTKISTLSLFQTPFSRSHYKMKMTNTISKSIYLETWKKSWYLVCHLSFQLQLELNFSWH